MFVHRAGAVRFGVHQFQANSAKSQSNVMYLPARCHCKVNPALCAGALFSGQGSIVRKLV